MHHALAHTPAHVFANKMTVQDNRHGSWFTITPAGEVALDSLSSNLPAAMPLQCIVLEATLGHRDRKFGWALPAFLGLHLVGELTQLCPHLDELLLDGGALPGQCAGGCRCGFSLQHGLSWLRPSRRHKVRSFQMPVLRFSCSDKGSASHAAQVFQPCYTWAASLLSMHDEEYACKDHKPMQGLAANHLICKSCQAV